MACRGEEMYNAKLKERDVIYLRTVKDENYHRTQDRIMDQRDVTQTCCTLARLGYSWAYLNDDYPPRYLDDYYR